MKYEKQLRTIYYIFLAVYSFFFVAITVALILFIKSGYYNLIIDNVASWFGFLNIVLCIIGLLIATVKLIPLLLDLIQVLGESYQEVNGTCVGY